MEEDMSGTSTASYAVGASIRNGQEVTPDLAALRDFVKHVVVSNDSDWAWKNYKSVVLALQREFDSRSLMEVGGGRSPLIDEQEHKSLGARYTVNDISDSELQLAPDWPFKACFDICSPPSNAASSFDLIFSKMVFEHIPDARAAYQAIYNLLVSDGICLSFFPTLYCLPFLLNYLFPERLALKLQRAFDSRANPKFPAFYSWCRSTASLQRHLETIGFRRVIICAFYGHNYYRSIPVVRAAERSWTEFTRKEDLRLFSSFAYAFVQK
jgi:SAM-dependent methyltransferase